MQIFRRENRALAAAIITALSTVVVLSVWTFAILATREKHEYENKLFDADIVITHRDAYPLSSVFGPGFGAASSGPIAIPGTDRVTSFLRRLAQVKCIFPIAAARARLLEDNPDRRMIAEIPIISIIDDACLESVPLSVGISSSYPSSKSPEARDFAFMIPSEALLNLLSMHTGHGDILSTSTFLLDSIGDSSTLHIRKVKILNGTITRTAGDALSLNFAVIDIDSFSKVTELRQAPYRVQAGTKSGQPPGQTGFTVPLGKGKPIDLPALFSILNTPEPGSGVSRSSLPPTHLFVYLADESPLQPETLSTQLVQFFETEKLPLVSRPVFGNNGFDMPWAALPVLFKEMPVIIWAMTILILAVAVFGNFAYLPSLDPVGPGRGLISRRILLTQGFSCVLGLAIWCLVTVFFRLAGKAVIAPLLAPAGLSLPDPSLIGLDMMPGVIVVFLFYALFMIIVPSVFPILQTFTVKKQGDIADQRK